MIDPTDVDIGRVVIYRRGDASEEGVITSIGKFFIFVRYGEDLYSKATLRHDLEWIINEP